MDSALTSQDTRLYLTLFNVRTKKPLEKAEGCSKRFGHHQNIFAPNLFTNLEWSAPKKLAAMIMTKKTSGEM